MEGGGLYYTSREEGCIILAFKKEFVKYINPMNTLKFICFLVSFTYLPNFFYTVLVVQ
jgi:hypothetical protein